MGRYQIVKRLAAGGMADLLLARADGISGFERHVVIKRIHPDLLGEERYVNMFLDEARLAAALHHQNIVQVNDVGIDGGEYYFAMEYLHAEDARSLLVLSSKHGRLIPIEHAITIVCGAAAGLHHAHEQCGPDRTPLHIVHRDVSPANILIGFDGSVKVADFGIALAARRAETTQAGMVKGKVAYMSPEQCNCERVDRRSDVFSLGIVLYELVTVHPCFGGGTEFQTMKSIVGGNFERPSRLNAAVDAELEQIICKALAPRPDARYQTADELRIALDDYAHRAGLRMSATALADYMKEQFGTRPLPWLVEENPDEILAIPSMPRVEATGTPVVDTAATSEVDAIDPPTNRKDDSSRRTEAMPPLRRPPAPPRHAESMTPRRTPTMPPRRGPPTMPPRRGPPPLPGRATTPSPRTATPPRGHSATTPPHRAATVPSRGGRPTQPLSPRGALKPDPLD